MPKLENIVNIINGELKVSQFSSKRFQGGSFDLISDSISEVKGTEEQVEITRPCIVDDNGELKDLTIDDTKSFQVYHKINEISYQEVQPQENFGDEGNWFQETANMSLIFIGDRARIKIREEEISAMISLYFPKKLSSIQCQSLKLYQSIISIDSVNINKEQVYNQEYKNIDFILKPNEMMFEIKYKIITTFIKNCIQLCE